ncbi:MAG: hypothetical protein HZC25_18010 [Rhodospirillales bacterium]|nr:hypothetical protein [Rhodospirillales bacterium]
MITRIVSGHRAGVAFACLALFSVFAAEPALASEASKALTNKAVEALRASDFALAARHSRDAIKADPTDGHAHFLSAIAANREGRFADALAALDTAAKLGNSSPEMAFEGGWALGGIGLNVDAINELNRYERMRPGSAATSALLARTYAASEFHGSALRHSAEAKRRDPALTPAMLLLEAKLAADQGDRAKAEQIGNQILADYPQSLEARRIKQAQTRGAKSGKPWEVHGEISFGFDSNVIGIGDEITRPSTISRQNSLFSHIAAGTSYTIATDPRGSLTFGYDGGGTVNFQVDGFNSHSHTPYLEYARRLSERWIGKVMIGANASFVEGDGLYSVSGIGQASAMYQWEPGSATEIKAAIVGTGFEMNPAMWEQNRDGVTYSLGAIHHQRVPGTKLDLRAGPTVSMAVTEGSDHDYVGFGLQIGARHPLWWGVVGDIGYSYTHTWYSHPHSYTNFIDDRDDDVHRFAARLTRPITGNITAFLRYDYLHQESNIVLYSYGQHQAAIGLAVQF